MEEIHYKELAHEIMETESRNPQGSQHGKSSLKASGLKIQEDLMFQIKCKGKERLMSQLKGAEQEEFPLPQPVFFLLRPSTGWVRPTHIREGNLLYSVHPFKY